MGFCILNKPLSQQSESARTATHRWYSGFILWEKIFANFVDLFLFVKILFTNILHVRAAPSGARSGSGARSRGVANVKAIHKKTIYTNASHSRKFSPTK